MKELVKTTFLWLLIGLIYALPTPALASQTEWATGPIFRGVEVTIDLPGESTADGGQRVWNIRAPIDKLGCCVFASIDMAARYQDIRALIGVIDRIKRGGGWPEKVAQVVKQAAEDAHSEPIEFVQYLGNDPAILDLAMKTGRPVCITYGYGEYPYNGATISHMVLLVHLDEQLACIIDNNNPLYDTWMSRAELLRRAMHPRGQYWAVVFLAPPAPPVPHNL